MVGDNPVKRRFSAATFLPMALGSYTTYKKDWVNGGA